MKGRCLILFRGKRISALSLLLTLLLFIWIVPACAESTDGNLLFNGDFEKLNAENLPEGWFTDAYLMNSGYSVYSVTDGAEGPGSHSVSIHNTTLNDARFAQTVQVEPESMYCLSGDILAENVTEGHGANLSIEGIYAFSEKIYDTEGKWKHIEYYGETGPNQYEITVFARLGGYSGESKGIAGFDHLVLKKVDDIPDGVYADLWFSRENGNSSYESSEPVEENESTARAALPELLIIFGIYAAAFLAAVYLWKDGNSDRLAKTEKKDSLRSAAVLLLALLIRIVFSYFVEGYSVDVNCFLSWGNTMSQVGPTRFYQSTSFCDYPPLYTYVLGMNARICSLLNAGTGLTRVIYRLIPSLCDIAGCWILLHVLKKNTDLNPYRKYIILLLAFNPVTILNSAAWGQMDSVLCLLLLSVAICATRRKWIPAVILYAVSVLVKPQALMLGFLGLACMISAVRKNPGDLRRILIGVLAGTGTILLLVLPFGIHQQPGWLIRQYGETLGSYPYATVNTANLYYLAGGNWNKISNLANIAAPVFLGAACALHGSLWYLKNRKEKYHLIETVIAAVFSCWFFGCAVFRTNWVFVGTAAMAYAFIIVISIMLRSNNISFMPYLGALLFVLLYVFGIKMHERYLFPAFLLLMYAWIIHRDRRILYLLLLFSFTVFVNEGIVLDNSIRLGAASGHLNADTVWLADILSILNILGALYAVILGYQLMKDRKPGPVQKLPSFLPVKTFEKSQRTVAELPDRKLHWNIRDSIALLGITILFSVVSLSTLGSHKAPQTFWTSSGENEQIVFDLQEDREDVTVLYFGQVSYYDFTVSQSSDGEIWGGEIPAQMDQGQCWKWKYITQYYTDSKGQRNYYSDAAHIVHFSGRYIRLTSDQVGLTLNEIMFRDKDGNRIPAVIVSRSGDNSDSVLWSDPETLLDEQDTMEKLPGFFGQEQEGPAQPSWWNSTYFDEIYHARTGFEFLNGTVPYETSHPPLGKVLISWCISLFGMTPFGWRFAGAAAGILMLPGIYLLTKQITKKTWTAAFACLLMALDCMHLTQTQIATIDSFPVLFIIFAFFFMLRFMQTDLNRCRIREAVIPLFFSGLFMGLSIASKWIGIYAGCGLAILYFWHCFRCSGKERINITDSGIDIFKRVIILSLWCVLFFIVIPLGIYLLSYIPYMAYNTRINGLGSYLNAVIRAQESMFNYHSTPRLGMDHPFYSPWWEWPIIGKPMYYASEMYVPYSAALHHSIFCFGNPVVWFGALGAMGILLLRWIGSKHYVIAGREERWHLKGITFDGHYGFLFISLLAQYLPWVLVPRGTYIYHYFASIPFLILGLAMCFSTDDRRLRKAAGILAAVFLAAAIVFFVLLLPYATGMAAPAEWLDIGKKILKIWY